MKSFLKILIFTFIVFLFNKTVLSQSNSSNNQTSDSTKKNSEIMPQFPGGTNALIEFINKKIKYPPKAVRKRIEGTVYVRFIINTMGEAVNFEIVSPVKLGYGLEEAAIEVLKKMPKWSPGLINNKPVDVTMSIPITFKVKN
ncbi:MAG: TonB family protein [Bacteroidia bacterium]|nr:TonB family protein [Bacteroidia bacterium]